MVACQAIANIVKSSLGPVGLDKVSSFDFFFLIDIVPFYILSSTSILSFNHV